MPFATRSLPTRFVPKVGLIREPNAEIRHTNMLDFWTVSRTNSLGFLDREPIAPERAAASCHIAIIGDSLVEASEVPIADKFHVRLEKLAARELPDLNITTSAFGRGGTGQLNQLPFYDQFARRLFPKLLVLVFVPNDFMNNSPILAALHTRWDPDRFPYVSAERNADGTMKLRPPDPDWRKYRLSRRRHMPVVKQVVRMSYFASWLYNKRGALFPLDSDPQLIARAELLSQRPGYELLLDDWQPTTRAATHPTFAEKELPPVFEEALHFTAFALDQFKERAERDGGSLVILATHRMKFPWSGMFDQMKAMAEARRIPVIDQHDYILRQGAKPKDAQWAHDAHWNAAGHQWAAEALLEYLKRNPEVCDSAP